MDSNPGLLSSALIEFGRCGNYCCHSMTDAKQHAGFAPLETLPAEWYNNYNYLLDTHINQVQTILRQAQTEIANVLEAGGQTPDATSTCQLLPAINCLIADARPAIATGSVPGLVASSNASNAVSVNGTTGVMTPNALCDWSASTTVKSCIESVVSGTVCNATLFAGCSCAEWKSIIEGSTVAQANSTLTFGNYTYEQAKADIRSGLSGNTGTVTSVSVYCDSALVQTITESGSICLSKNAFNAYAEISTIVYPGACCTGTSDYVVTTKVCCSATADTAASASASSSLSYTGTGTSSVTANQTPQLYCGCTGWASYLHLNYSDANYGQMLRFPFWDVPQYQRIEDGSLCGWHTFITDENIASQSVASASSIVDRYDANRCLFIGYGGTSLSCSQISYLAAFSSGIYESDKVVIKDVSREEIQAWLGLGAAAYCDVNYAACCIALGVPGWAVMRYQAQSGQPTYLWGSNDSSGLYIWSPEEVLTGGIASGGAKARAECTNEFNIYPGTGADAWINFRGGASTLIIGDGNASSNAWGNLKANVICAIEVCVSNGLSISADSRAPIHLENGYNVLHIGNDREVALGYNASALAYGVALGNNAGANTFGIAVSIEACAASESIALGVASKALTDKTVAIGAHSCATGCRIMHMRSGTWRRAVFSFAKGTQQCVIWNWLAACGSDYSPMWPAYNCSGSYCGMHIAGGVWQMRNAGCSEFGFALSWDGDSNIDFTAVHRGADHNIYRDCTATIPERIMVDVSWETEYS